MFPTQMNLVAGPSEMLIKACMALAAHFKGNGGLDFNFNTPRKGRKPSLRITKNGKKIYQGAGGSPETCITALVLDIIKVEKIRGDGDRHRKCHTCEFIFEVIESSAMALEAGIAITKRIQGFAAAQQEQRTPPPEEEGSPKEVVKPEDMPN